MVTLFRAFRIDLPGVQNVQWTFVLHRPKRSVDPHVSFPPSICRIYCTWFRVAIGLYLVSQTYPHVQPYMRFLSVRPEVCPWVSMFPTSGFLQIPPNDGHPCLRLYPSRYRADLGLSPLRNVRRQAHKKKPDKGQALGSSLIRSIISAE